MENKNLKKYESVIILKENLSEEEYHKAFDKIKNYMESLVEFEKIKELGLKRLAYAVKNNEKGYFIAIYCKANEENVKKLERLYRIDENIIKFIIVRKDD